MSKTTAAANLNTAYCGRVAFVLLLQVKGANPNGDPTDGNRPRTTPEGYGLITAECIRRKIRNMLQGMGEVIYLKSNDRADDGYKSILGRLMGNPEIANAIESRDDDKIRKLVLKNYVDARAFGGVFTKKGKNKGEGTSVGITGAITIQNAYSVDPVTITEIEIVKSTNGESEEGKASDTRGRKYYVDYGLYVIKGSVSRVLAEKNGFTVDDWAHVKQALLHLCDNDESAARPAGSMAVKQAYFWPGDVTNNGLSRLFDSVSINLKDGVSAPARFEDYEITLLPEAGRNAEVIIAD